MANSHKVKKGVKPNKSNKVKNQKRIETNQSIIKKLSNKE